MILAFAAWRVVVCAPLRPSGASGWAWRRGRTAPSSVARLALIANNTRLLADDWLNVHGHRVVLTETFCDPERFTGTLYRAAGWEKLGKTRGFARANGRDARALLGSLCQRTSCRPPGPEQEAHARLRAHRAHPRRDGEHEGLPGCRAVRVLSHLRRNWRPSVPGGTRRRGFVSQSPSRPSTGSCRRSTRKPWRT